MGKTIHHGLRKPDDPIYQSGWTVSFGGLLGKDSKPKGSPLPEASPKPSTYKEHPGDETFYPRNPKDRPKLP